MYYKNLFVLIILCITVFSYHTIAYEFRNFDNYIYSKNSSVSRNHLEEVIAGRDHDPVDIKWYIIKAGDSQNDEFVTLLKKIAVKFGKIDSNFILCEYALESIYNINPELDFFRNLILHYYNTSEYDPLVAYSIKILSKNPNIKSTLLINSITKNQLPSFSASLANSYINNDISRKRFNSIKVTEFKISFLINFMRNNPYYTEGRISRNSWTTKALFELSEIEPELCLNTIINLYANNEKYSNEVERIFDDKMHKNLRESLIDICSEKVQNIYRRHEPLYKPDPSRL